MGYGINHTHTHMYMQFLVEKNGSGWQPDRRNSSSAHIFPTAAVLASLTKQPSRSKLSLLPHCNSLEKVTAYVRSLLNRWNCRHCWNCCCCWNFWNCWHCCLSFLSLLSLCGSVRRVRGTSLNVTSGLDAERQLRFSSA